MITLLVKIYNNITQNLYDKVIDSIDFNTLCCPYCKHHQLIRHGTYQRHLKENNADTTLTVVRVRCTQCGHTHALLLDSIVPYSQFSLNDQVNVIINLDNKDNLNRIMENNPFIDESTIYHIRKKYNSFYLQLLKANDIFLKIETICQQCFELVCRQFMQIKTTINWLYRANNISLLQYSFPFI